MYIHDRSSFLFKTSFDFRNLESVYTVRNWLMSAFIYTAMVNYPTEANFMKPLPAYPVKEVLLLTLTDMNLQIVVRTSRNLK